MKINWIVCSIFSHSTQKSLQKASLTNQSQEPLFTTFGQKNQDQDKHENQNVDLSGQVSKKYEVLKASKTKEQIVQSESIC